MTALILMVALVVCGMTGRVLRQRFLRRQSVQLQHNERSLLLGQLYSQSDVCADEPPGLPAAAVGDARGAQRRAKVAKMLQKLGFDTSHGFEMLPMEGLPTQLAHRLGYARMASLASTPGSKSPPQPSSRQRILGTKSLQLKSGEMEARPHAWQVAHAHMPNYCFSHAHMLA